MNEEKLKHFLHLTFTLIILNLQQLCAQNQVARDCWYITPGKENLFFHNLFSNVTENDPGLSLVRCEFKNSQVSTMCGIQVMRAYCKLKYKLDDSAVKSFTKNFVRNNSKLDLVDTLILKSIMFPNPLILIPGTELEQYRSLGAQNFLVKYFEGDIPREKLSLAFLPYLFEKRMSFSYTTGRLMNAALRQFEKDCKLKWDYSKKMWTSIQ